MSDRLLIGKLKSLGTLNCCILDGGLVRLKNACYNDAKTINRGVIFDIKEL